MYLPEFTDFFTGRALECLHQSIAFSLAEDGVDLTSNAIFSQTSMMKAKLIAKEDTLLAGLPFIPLIMQATEELEPGTWSFTPHVKEGAWLSNGTHVASLEGTSRIILRAERILLNFITHLSGIANVVKQYADALQGTKVKLLDTRKTLPCLRYPEKYAVLIGGGYNHRKNLSELLMLKDNHIDAKGSITAAVNTLRGAYTPMPPLEVECRTLAEVSEAVACKVDRIMLDNMDYATIEKSLDTIPLDTEVEISGGVTHNTIRNLAEIGNNRKADFISVGRLTHSAPSADYSLITELA